MDDQVVTLIIGQVKDGFLRLEGKLDHVGTRLDDHSKRITAIEVGGCGRLDEHLGILAVEPPTPRTLRAKVKDAAIPTSIGAGLGAMLVEAVRRWLGH